MDDLGVPHFRKPPHSHGNETKHFQTSPFNNEDFSSKHADYLSDKSWGLTIEQWITSLWIMNYGSTSNLLPFEAGVCGSNLKGYNSDTQC